MDEFENTEINSMIDALSSLAQLDESLLNEQSMGLIKDQIKLGLSPAVVAQSVGQMINSFEEQGLTKEEVANSIQALREVLDEIAYSGGPYSDNKKEIIDNIMGGLYSVFDRVLEKYHSYAIELPMTVDVGAKVPTYAHDTDAAADLYAMDEAVLLPHSLGNKIHTGIKIQLPEGWLALILPRSSMGTKTPLRLSNSVGLIDSGYRGELGVLYDNISDNTYTINAGDRIAQLLVMPSYRFQAKVVDILADSDRGETGFGDSGK